MATPGRSLPHPEEVKGDSGETPAGALPDHRHARAGITRRSASLVMGRVSDDPEKYIKRYQPLLDYVVNRLGDLDIKHGSVLIARDNEEMVHYLRTGRVDWVQETAFSALVFSEQAGAMLALRAWRDGVPTYHSVLFVRQDSPVHSLSDLMGRTIAFEDPGSTTSFFLPAITLHAAGLPLVRLADPMEKPPREKVGYIFAGGELTITAWVYKGLVTAGAFSNLDWDDPALTPERYKKQLRIFHQTRGVPRAIELFRKDLDPRIRKRIEQILLRAHENPTGRDALKSYNDTYRFDPLTKDIRDELQRIRKTLDSVHGQLGQDGP